MSKLIDILQRKDELIVGKPAEDGEVDKVEKMLGVKFSDEYRSILKTFGFVCVDGHEITGIANAKRINVYDVTMKERANNDCDLSGLYVVEQTHIDGVVIWQSASGEVYQTVAGTEPEKIYDSLLKYIEGIC